MPNSYATPAWFQRLITAIERALIPPQGSGRLLRPRSPRVIAGVCSGVAEYFGWDITILRVLVVVLAVSSFGIMVLAYLAGWVLIPEGAYALPRQSGTSAP